jgi:hypothetical protein
MNQLIVPAPVHRSVTVNTDPVRAFAVFTGSIGRWWPRTHTVGAAPMATVTIEPFAGGRWYETGDDGSEAEWGKVLAWEPPARVLLAWQLNAEFRFDPDLITEVEITLTAEGENCTRVELEHRRLERLGDQAEKLAALVGSPNGWTAVLGRYAGSCSP